MKMNVVTKSIRRRERVHDILKRALSSSPSASSLTLYQYAICPFCHKAKALLSYASIPHQIVEVNPLTKAELKSLDDQTHKKVPVAVIEDQQKQINGSNEILQHLLNDPKVQQSLSDKWNGDQEMTLETFRQGEHVERWWYRYADDELASLLYPNVCRTLTDSRAAFSYVKNVHNFSPLQKIMIHNLGALAMYFAASKIKSKHNIKNEQKALQTALDIFEKEALEEGQYLFSSQRTVPDMGDLTVYGVLRSVKGLPAHDFALKESRESNILLDWYMRMEKEVEGDPDGDHHRNDDTGGDK